MSENNTQEKTIFQEGNIHITDKRAVLGAKTYSIANITSVSTVENKPSACFPFVLISLGFLAVLSYIIMLFSSESTPSVLIIGLIMVGIGFLIVRSQSTSYKIKIGSASGEIDGMTSKDKELISRIVKAMNEAIIMR